LIRVLDLEAHNLQSWEPTLEPGFFLQQLRNCCLELGRGELQALAEARLEKEKWSWLREHMPTSRASEALVRTLEGHTSAVYGVVVTADDRFAVSASGDKTLKVWDLATGQALRTLEGHTDAVHGVAVTADGHFVVSASDDRTLKVWDCATGQTLFTLEGHTAAVYGVVVTADGRFAVSASWDRTLKMWDLATGQVIRTLEGHTSSVTGVAVALNGRFAISASWDRTLKVWDLATGKTISTRTAGAPLMSCALTPDGRTIVVGDAMGAIHFLDWVNPCA
jgi:WD40 repeat protein